MIGAAGKPVRLHRFDGSEDRPTGRQGAGIGACGAAAAKNVTTPDRRLGQREWPTMVVFVSRAGGGDAKSDGLCDCSDRERDFGRGQQCWKWIAIERPGIRHR